MISSRQSELVSMHPIGKWSGREVRDILTNDKVLPEDITDKLHFRLVSYCSVNMLMNTVDQGCINYAGLKYKVCYGTTPWALKKNFTEVVIDLRYWGILPIGFAYVTGLQEAWTGLYPNGPIILQKGKRGY